MLNYLDSHPDVISYASEEFFIPYLSPIDNKLHKYYPDMLVKRRNKQGIVETLVVELARQWRFRHSELRTAAHH